MYIWDLEKWYWWTNLQGKNEDADIEKGFVDTVGEGESMMGEESSINMYTLPCVKSIAGEKLLCNTGSPASQSVML